MARKVSLSKDSDSNESVPRRDDTSGDNGSRNSADQTASRGEVQQEAMADKCDASGKCDVPVYAVPWLYHTVPLGMAPLAGGQSVQCELLRTAERTAQMLPRDVTDGIDPEAAREHGVARGAEQLDSASALSMRFEERLIWLAEASERIHGILCHVWSRMPHGLPVVCRTLGTGVSEDGSRERGTTSDDIQMLLSMVHYGTSGVGENPRDSRETHLHQGRLCRFARATGESRQNHHHLANAACVDLEAALRLALSLKNGVESAIASVPQFRSSPRTWIPHKLASRVSRVQYYSKNYAEEVSSGPLEVAGYTVRLSVRCAIEAGDVSLSFSLQFCANASNDRVQWPFKGALQLMIHHPTDPTRSRRHRVPPSRPEGTTMPRNVDNVPLHLAGPVPAMTLDQEGLWAMRTLHLSISFSS